MNTKRLLINACVLGVLAAGTVVSQNRVTPVQQQPVQQSPTTNKPKDIVLGEHRIAKLTAWTMLCCMSLLGTAATYNFCYAFFNTVAKNMPFLDIYNHTVAQVAGGIATLPLVAAGLAKGGSLTWYTTYVFVSGERVSPILARAILSDIQVYVQHLTLLKSVEKDLLLVIDQINQMAGKLEAKAERGVAIDPNILQQMHELIEQDEARIQQILLQLQTYLSPEEIAHYMQSAGVARVSPAYSIAPDLFAHAQVIIDHLKNVHNDIGHDAEMLRNLINELIEYWQDYTQGLAESINADMSFCNGMHAMEQLIVKLLHRPLVYI